MLISQCFIRTATKGLSAATKRSPQKGSSIASTRDARRIQRRGGVGQGMAGLRDRAKKGREVGVTASRPRTGRQEKSAFPGRSLSLSGSDQTAIARGEISFAMVLALAFSATRRSYAPCRFSQPCASLPGNGTSELRCSVGRNSTVAIDDFAKSRVRNVQGQGQRSDADAHGLDVVLQQNLARVDRTHTIFEHVVLQCCSVIQAPSPRSMRVLDQSVIGAV